MQRLRRINVLQRTFASQQLVVWITAALLVGVGWTARGGALAPPHGRDSELYRAIIERLQSGESYYSATAVELHTRGYATLPAFNWRLPTLAIFQAALPGPRAGTVVLTVLGVVTIFFWCLSASTVPQLIAIVLSQMTLLPAWLEPRVNVFHELWAGQLIALSLAARMSGWWRVSLLAGALALGIREHALLYVVLMAVLAFRERAFREGLAWTAVVAIFVAGLAVHHAAVLGSVPSDPIVGGWMGWVGWPQVLASARANFVLFRWPSVGLVFLVPVLWAGLFSLKVPDRGRLGLTVSLYFLVFATIARPDNWYWGMLVAPLLPLGVVGLLQSLSVIGAGASSDSTRT